jgi:hypothetical protein
MMVLAVSFVANWANQDEAITFAQRGNPSL